MLIKVGMVTYVGNGVLVFVGSAAPSSRGGGPDLAGPSLWVPLFILTPFDVE